MCTSVADASGISTHIGPMSSELSSYCADCPVPGQLRGARGFPHGLPRLAFPITSYNVLLVAAWFRRIGWARRVRT
jgi:hypothetical protein